MARTHWNHLVCTKFIKHQSMDQSELQLKLSASHKSKPSLHLLQINCAQECYEKPQTQSKSEVWTLHNMKKKKRKKTKNLHEEENSQREKPHKHATREG